MASNVIKEFLVGLGVDPDTEKVEKFDQGLQDARDSMRSIVEVGAAVTATVGAVGTSLFMAANRAAQTTVEMERQAESVGMAREEYQGLAQMARRYNLESKDMQDVLSVVADRADDAMRGTSSFVEAFGMVGIEAKELKGLEPQEVFFKYAEAIRNTESDMTRLASSERLLGGELGQKLMPMLQMGGERLRWFQARLDQLGTTMEDDSVRAAKKFETSTFLATEAWKGFVRMVGQSAMPALQGIIDRVLDWYAANQKLVEERVSRFISEITSRVVSFTESALTTLEAVDEVVQKLGGWAAVLSTLSQVISTIALGWFANQIFTIIGAIGTMWANLSGLLGSLSAGTGVIGTLGSAFTALQAILGSAAAAGGVLTAAIAALVFIFEDLYTYFQGGDSLTGRFIEWAKTSKSVQDALDSVYDASKQLGRVWEQIKNIGAALWPFVHAGVIGMWEVWQRAFQNIWAFTSPILTLLLDLIGNVFVGAEAWLLLFQGKWGKAWSKFKEAAVGQLKAIRDFFYNLWDGIVGAVERFLSFSGDVEASVKKNVDFKGPDGGGGGGSPPSMAAPAGREAQAQRVAQQRRDQQIAQASSSMEVNQEIVAREGQSEEDIGRIAAEKVEEKQQEQNRDLKEAFGSGAEQ